MGRIDSLCGWTISHPTLDSATPSCIVGWLLSKGARLLPTWFDWVCHSWDGWPTHLFLLKESSEDSTEGPGGHNIQTVEETYFYYALYTSWHGRATPDCVIYVWLVVLKFCFYHQAAYIFLSFFSCRWLFSAFIWFRDTQLFFWFPLYAKFPVFFSLHNLNNSSIILNHRSHSGGIDAKVSKRTHHTNLSWQNVLLVGVLIFTAHFHFKKKGAREKKRPFLFTYV